MWQKRGKSEGRRTELTITGLKMEEGDYEPRNVVSL